MFTPDFKREVVQQVLMGEKALAELSREHDIGPTVIRNWKRRYESGASTAVKANEDVQAGWGAWADGGIMRMGG